MNSLLSRLASAGHRLDSSVAGQLQGAKDLFTPSSHPSDRGRGEGLSKRRVKTGGLLQ